jgi:hypothetical protein
MGSEGTCTCSPDDFGMGHGAGCPVGERNRRRSVLDICERLAGYGVPESALLPIREWVARLALSATEVKGPPDAK